MTQLVIRNGMNKSASAEDGPSFEQQFGTLANAVVADKFPAMDRMKVAFQLIEKKDDNSDACGATVYLIGNNVVYVPAFFKRGKIQTGDMMFLAQTQQFLPLSDPWISYVKGKDLQEAGSLLPADYGPANNNTKGDTIRTLMDPLMKTANAYFKLLLHTEPDMQKREDNGSILDTALSLGKTAAQTLAKNLADNNDALNAALTFYSAEDLSKFAAKVSETPVQECTKLILPFEKEAKALDAEDMDVLMHDGYFIVKKASGKDCNPTVVQKHILNNLITTIGKPCHTGVLDQSGSIKECDVVSGMRASDLIHNRSTSGYSVLDGVPSVQDAKTFMRSNLRMFVISGSKYQEIPKDAMCLESYTRPFSADNLKGVGEDLASYTGEISYDSLLVIPDGTAVVCDIGTFKKAEDGDGWVDYFDKIIKVSKDKAQTQPVCSESMLLLPVGTRIINRTKGDKPICSFVTTATLNYFMQEFQKGYNSVKLYHNGSDYIITGPKSESSSMGVKEAAFHLVDAYSIKPCVAKRMLKQAVDGANGNHPKTLTYLVEKVASYPDSWPDANINMQKVNNPQPTETMYQMPTVQENPEMLQQAIQTAAQQGIKEVFDVTELKILVRQNRFFDTIQEDIPLFMRTIDSLCRKLFQFYWHTDKMEEKYGMVKLKALEESLKVTLDSLSELTVFFKLRTVDGTGLTGDTSGDLMTGQML